MRPTATARRANLASVKLAGNRVEASMSGGLYLPDDRQDIDRKLTRLGLQGLVRALHRAGRVRRTQARPACLGRR
jgi:hypothetical protein